MALTIGRRLVLAVIAGSALTAAPPALAQPVEIPATFGGDFLSRPRLTGDWFGLRDEMGKRGVTLDKTGCAQRGRAIGQCTLEAGRTKADAPVVDNEGRKR